VCTTVGSRSKPDWSTNSMVLPSFKAPFELRPTFFLPVPYGLTAYRAEKDTCEAGLWPFVSVRGRVRSSPQSATKEVSMRALPR
jgi:hypothetical protein